MRYHGEGVEVGGICVQKTGELVYMYFWIAIGVHDEVFFSFWRHLHVGIAIRRPYSNRPL